MIIVLYTVKQAFQNKNNYTYIKIWCFSLLISFGVYELTQILIFKLSKLILNKNYKMMTQIFE